MASCMGLIGSFIVLSALLMGATEGTEYIVGDSLGWRFPPNESYYSDWASTKTFLLGDKLIFKWTGNHTVGDVTKADYDNCNTKASAFGTNVNEVEVRVNIMHTGPRYFICTVGEHCIRGMKLSINVESGNAAAPVAPPPGSSSPIAPIPGSSAPTLSLTVLPLILSATVAYFFGGI